LGDAGATLPAPGDGLISLQQWPGDSTQTILLEAEVFEFGQPLSPRVSECLDEREKAAQKSIGTPF
jgi:hypothetical protein